MSKVSNPEVVSDQDDEMLVEYDFSNGVRGKHHDRALVPPLPGIQFLKDSSGQKTALLLDIQLHHDLWREIVSSSADPSEFQYLTVAQTHTQSVFLDFKIHLELWQMLYDRIAS